jgi:hypothetical protein
MRAGQTSNKNRTDLLRYALRVAITPHVTGDTPMIVDVFRIAR